MKQSLAQKRARHALDKVNELNELKKRNDYGKYLSYVKALPATIIMTGLGQAMAMEKAGTKDKGHGFLYGHMNDWLCNNNGNGWQHSPYKKKDDVLGAITSLDEDSYICVQAEAIEYLEWLKKFAVAELDEERSP